MVALANATSGGNTNRYHGDVVHGEETLVLTHDVMWWWVAGVTQWLQGSRDDNGHSCPCSSGSFCVGNFVRY